MSVIDWIAQGCHHCGSPFGERFWKGRALPWMFCTQQCARDYHEKDGREGDGALFHSDEEAFYAAGPAGRMRITREEYEALREAGANVKDTGVTQ